MITLRRRRGFATCLLVTGAAACNAYVEPGNYQTGSPPMLVIGQPSQQPSGADAAPPANIDADIVDVMPALGGNRSGVYSGIIEPLDGGGGLCTSSQGVRNFRVRGNTVRWQQFRGRIVGSGLQMRHGNDWLIGEFIDGNQFSGQIGAYGPDQPPGCTWRIRLSKTGT
jgi:hypothetical protein